MALVVPRKKVKKSAIKSTKKGQGFVNSLIERLPFEVHLPSYQYCGPGTKLKKRLQRNDPGINQLDRACREHDIAYSNNTDVAERNRADNILAAKAWQRFKSRDAGLGERAAAISVSGIMKAKSAMGAGAGMKKKKNQRKQQRKPKKMAGTGMQFQQRKKQADVVPIPAVFRSAVKNAKHSIHQHKPKSLAEASHVALRAAKAVIKANKIRKRDASKGLPRIIPVPKIGGIIPLIPVFAGLSALGALMGGSAGIAGAVISANKAKKDYKELKRHNQIMEAISLGEKQGAGMKRPGGVRLHLKPYKNGLGLFLTPYESSKNVY